MYTLQRQFLGRARNSAELPVPANAIGHRPLIVIHPTVFLHLITVNKHLTSTFRGILRCSDRFSRSGTYGIVPGPRPALHQTEADATSSFRRPLCFSCIANLLLGVYTTAPLARLSRTSLTSELDFSTLAAITPCRHRDLLADRCAHRASLADNRFAVAKPLSGPVF